jgi:signal peptidase I
VRSTLEPVTTAPAVQDSGSLPRWTPPEAGDSSTHIRRVAPPEPAPLPDHGLLHSFQSLLYVITVALFIITFIAQPFRIPSESMLPTLLVGDFLLVDKQVGPEPSHAPFAPANQIHRGDLIVFHYPVVPSLHLVKRVVAIPGDRIHLHDGRVILNGRPISEPYAIFRPAAADNYRDEFPRFTSADPGADSRWWIEMRSLVSGGELTIPPGHFFVLGDNRNDSEDSRYWGLVPASAIVGKPFLVYFSLNNPSAVAGQSFAAALPGNAVHTSFAQSSPAPAAGFSRWNRVLHVIR